MSKYEISDRSIQIAIGKLFICQKSMKKYDARLWISAKNIARALRKKKHFNEANDFISKFSELNRRTLKK